MFKSVPIHVRRVQESLGRDTSYVQTGPAKSATAFHASRLKAQLRSLNSCDIATRTSSHHDNVVRPYIERKVVVGHRETGRWGNGGYP
jgi:hypothetical protein